MNFKSHKISLLALPLLLTAIGCESGEKRVYEIAVKNNSSHPITVGPVKTGPTFEPDWASPSEVAINTPKNPEQMWGVILQPGKTASTIMKGQFAQDSQAFILIYQGNLTLSDILAITKDSPARCDWRLTHSRTTLIVSDRGEFIDVFESPNEMPLAPKTPATAR